MRLFASALSVALFAVTTFAQNSGTLADILQNQGIPSHGLTPESLQQKVVNFASHSEGDRLTIAYYTNPQESSPLWIRSFDRQKHRWTSKSFSRVSDMGPGTMDVCLGSLDDLSLIGDNLIVTTHLNPSAECTIVFSSALDLKRSIYGWIVATTHSNLSLIEHSEIHFAPTHPVELSVYDHSRNTLAPVFPAKNDPSRNDFIEYLKNHRDLDWCRENNSHCDPERFGADLGEVKAGEESDSFAFYVTFSSEGYGASATENRELMYVFRRRGDAWDYREFPKAAAPYTLNDAISPYTLPHLFEDTQHP